LLPARLASFARKFPRVQVSVVEDSTNELLHRVQDGTVDLALLALPVPATNCLCQELFRERLYLVVPENHRLASHSEGYLEEIENDPFLLPKEGHGFRENTLSACGRARVQPNVVFESGQFTTLLAMVTAGTGVSVVPEMALRNGSTAASFRWPIKMLFAASASYKSKDTFEAESIRPFRSTCRNPDRRQKLRRR
jgi:LysR family transcriptional regulator, hydrogen peroxide-inducible genes activator